MTSQVTLVPAGPEDARAIARLFLIASDGLAEYIWRKMDLAGLTLMDVGEQRYRRENVAFSYQNCIVAKEADTVIGMAHSFPMEAPTSAATVETDPVLFPYSKLEDYGSLYLAGLAMFPEHRANGIGTRLLEATHQRALALGLPRVSLICFERNSGAMRLYERRGYQEMARRPMHPHPTLRYAEGNAVLLHTTLCRGLDHRERGRAPSQPPASEAR